MIFTQTIQTDKNTWTFDVVVKQGIVTVLNIYGDITNQKHLEEAIEKLKLIV